MAGIAVIVGLPAIHRGVHDDLAARTFLLRSAASAHMCDAFRLRHDRHVDEVQLAISSNTARRDRGPKKRPGFYFDGAVRSSFAWRRSSR
jgi:hypothetical protein